MIASLNFADIENVFRLNLAFVDLARIVIPIWIPNIMKGAADWIRGPDRRGLLRLRDRV